MRSLLGLLFALMLGAVQAQNTDTPVSYASTGETLEQTSMRLEQALGMRVTLVQLDTKATIKGNFSGSTKAQFLNDFAKKSQFEWALGKNEVFLASSQAHDTISIEAPDSDIAYKLQDLFIREFRQQGSSISTKLVNKTLFVTGIAPWLSQVAKPRLPSLLTQAKNEIRAQLNPNSNLTRVIYAPKDSNQNGLMIFQLHNAWADDKRQVVNGGVQIVPGVASLFRQFTGMPALPPTQVYAPNNSTRIEREPNINGAQPTTRSAQAQNGGNSIFSLFSKNPEDDLSVNANRGVFADMRLNAVLVRDKVALFEHYKQLIQTLDRPADMVQMDAFIVDINRSRVNEFGLNFNWGNNSVGANGANVVLNQLNASNLISRLRALESTGDSQFLTVPTVVSMNNLEAIFSARDNFYISVKGFQDSSLNKVTAETILRVTPLIANDNNMVSPEERRVKLLVNIQDANVDSTQATDSGNLPRILENQITTQAVVRAGDTLVIGGQVVRKRASGKNGLPFISRVPIIGWLTSTTQEEQTDYLRIYMVRPRILGEDSASANKASRDGNVNLVYASQVIEQTKRQITQDALPTIPVISSSQEAQ